MSSLCCHRRETTKSWPRGCGRRLLQAALLAGVPCAALRAESIDWSLGVASATVLRGIALGAGGVDLQAAASYADAAGWRANLGVAALHSKPSNDRWEAQLFWRFGYARQIDDDWSAQLAHTRYAYPESSALRRYAHDELGATLAFRDLLYLSVASLRRTHYETSAGRYSVAYDVVARHALPSSVWAGAGLGYLDSRGSSFAYTYGHLGLGAQWGAVLAQLNYIATDDAAKRRYGDAASNRWAASLSRIF
jgi:uncharacterized protein (TIGR02001 family)